MSLPTATLVVVLMCFLQICAAVNYFAGFHDHAAREAAPVR